MIIITTYGRHQEGLALRMLHSFRERWPGEIHIIAYHERDKQGYVNDIEYLPLFRCCPELLEFQQKFAKHNGRDGKRYNYNRDAVKFAAKSFAIIHCCLHNRDKIFWFDVDTIAHRNAPQSFIDQLLPDGIFSSYLGREGYHTETGFLGFDTRLPESICKGRRFSVIDFFEDWRKLYLYGGIFNLDYWHDCGAYDFLRSSYSACFKFNNLSPHGTKVDHVFVQSILGDYCDHMKGPVRQKRGRSTKADLRYHKKDMEYWR